jgi:hypothetical protein
MTVGVEMQLAPDYLRLQADRCHRLSRSCMDLGTARDLRLMAEEYFGEASKIEITVRDAKHESSLAPAKPKDAAS